MAERRDLSITVDEILATLGASLGVAAIAAPGQGLAAVGVAAVPTVVTGLVRCARRYCERNTLAVVEARDDAFRDWVIGWVRQLPELVADLRSVEHHLERLDERIQDPQFHRLLDNFGIEASREATDERRRMLTHATAGAFDVTITIAEAARAERTIRELDPEDIEKLRHLNERERSAGGRFVHDDGVDVLVGAGCVRTKWGAGAGLAGAEPDGSIVTYRTTGLGGLVMSMLRSYEVRP